jgi:hypothetical protein
MEYDTNSGKVTQPGGYPLSVYPGPTPKVTSLTPATGAAAGGTEVTVTGSDLTDATGVTFDGAAGTAFSVTDYFTVKATTPAHAAGAVDVVVQHPEGNVTVTDGFTYTA